MKLKHPTVVEISIALDKLPTKRDTYTYTFEIINYSLKKDFYYIHYTESTRAQAHTAALHNAAIYNYQQITSIPQIIPTILASITIIAAWQLGYDMKTAPTERRTLLLSSECVFLFLFLSSSLINFMTIEISLYLYLTYLNNVRCIKMYQYVRVSLNTILVRKLPIWYHW